MAVQLEQLIAYLRRGQWLFRLDTESDLIVCRGQGARRRWPIEIRLTEGGDCLHLRVGRVVTLDQSRHVPALLAELLSLHYRIKLGRFGLDPAGREIDCEVVIPLDDSGLSYRQFDRALGTLLLLVDQQAPRLERLLADGPEPEPEPDDDQMQRFLDELARATGLPPDVIAQTLRESDSQPDPAENDE